MKRIYWLILPAITFLIITFNSVTSPAQKTSIDPLPSWNQGTVKTTIIDFVDRTTTKGSPNYILPEKRIATFDNDGTLWVEKPIIQGMFILESLKKLAKNDPTIQEKQPFKALLERDIAYIKEAGEEAIMELFTVIYHNQTEEEFKTNISNFFVNSFHPTLKVPYNQLTYQPMLELMTYLREKGFQTWICSGGGIDFMRVISEELYDIPPQQIIGSSLTKEFLVKDGKGVLVRKSKLNSFNDKAMKPVNIDLHIGITPVLAVGNVRNGGDIAMLTYSQNNPISLQLLINHDDNKREFAYSESDNASLNMAKERNWQVVSMREDWQTIFAFKNKPQE